MRQRVRWSQYAHSLFPNTTGGTDLRVTGVRLIGQESCEGITYFRLRLHAADQGSTIGEWDVLHRYSEFDKLRNDLGVRDRRVGSIFPEKTGFSACAGWQVDQRMVLLQSWLDGLIAEISSGGDGSHLIMPMNRRRKVAVLHQFFGLDGEGQLLPNATLVPSAPPLMEVVVPPLAIAAAAEEAATKTAPSTPESSVAMQNTEEDAELQAPLAASIAPPDVQREVVTVEVDAQLQAAFTSTAASADGLTEVVSAEEDAELQAALAASVAHSRQGESHLLAEEDSQLQAAMEASRVAQTLDKDARIRSDMHVAEALKKSKEEHRLSIDSEFQRGMALLQAKAAKEKEEEKEDELARCKEEDYARCTAAAETQSKMLQEVTLKAEQEQAWRLEQEEDARRKVADEHDAKCRSDKEEAQRKAEEAEKSWLQRAMDAAALARQFEDQGEQHPALDHYRKCVAMFTIALKKEPSERVRSAIQQKMADLVLRANHLSDTMMAADAAQAATILAGSAAVGACLQGGYPSGSEPVAIGASGFPARSLASESPPFGQDDNAASRVHRALIPEA